MSAFAFFGALELGLLFGAWLVVWLSSFGRVFNFPSAGFP